MQDEAIKARYAMAVVPPYSLVFSLANQPLRAERLPVEVPPECQEKVAESLIGGKPNSLEPDRTRLSYSSSPLPVCFSPCV